MSHNTAPAADVFIRIREQWILLTEDDVREGVKHRSNFLERLRFRHNLGLEDAERQLADFEKKNPSFFFEKSE